MDPVTHVLLGANLGCAFFGRRLGRVAALAGGLAALAPDADIFIQSATDPLLAIEYHRGFTHAFAFAPLGAAVVAAPWLLLAAWRHRPRWLALWTCCLVAYLSHVLLDASTSYGTRLLWPFTDRREGWDLIAIIDPPFTLALLLGLVRSLAGGIRARPAVLALLACSAYLGFGGVQRARATEAIRQLALSRGHAIQRIEVMPTLANNIVWRTLYLHEGQIHADRVRVGWFSAPTVREGWSLPLLRDSELPTDDRRRSFERFAWFSDGWVARSPHDATVLGDMRYSLSSEAFDPIWGIRFNPPGSPTVISWVNRSGERDLRIHLLWAEIIGRDLRFRVPPRS